MEPKDMEHVTLIIGLSSALQVEGNIANNPYDRIYALNYRKTMEGELLRRLNEADELRKENEELLKALDYVASFISIEDVGDESVCPGVSISSERFEEHATINGVLGFDECEHPFSQSIVDVLKRSAKAKESEASHE